MKTDLELYMNDDFQLISKPDPLQNSLYNRMVAVGKALMRASKDMSMTEYKVLMMALTKMNWAKGDQTNVVELDKIEVCEVLRLNYDGSDRSRELRKIFQALVKHSFVEMDGEDKEEWDDGFLLTRMRSTRGSILLYFGEQFMPLLTDLMKDKDFVTIWANDIYKFNSVYSYLLFEELRLHSDTSKTNWRTYSTKQLKELFGIPKDGKGSYMHYSKKDGKEVFDRSNFEKYVLDMAIEEINKGQMVKILPIPDSAEAKKGKCYEKVKRNGYVAGYMFKYWVRTRTMPPVMDQLPGQMNINDFPDFLPDKKGAAKCD